MIRALFVLILFACSNLAFAEGKQLTGAYAPAATVALSPSDSQKSFAVPPGFEVRLFAAEPDIINPVAMTWDERGRLWVVELFEYPMGAPKGAKPRDRIKILEDTDGDGRADKVTIFADGLNLATGIALGNGGVYVGQAPDLLFLRDTNRDDHADTREVLLTGFDTNDRHELLNGFTWGPDGWLYMTHGVFNHSKVRHPSSSSSSSNSPHTFEASEPGIEVSAALCRYHPHTKKFEVFADGTSNPWGVDFDAAGNAFVSACVIDHLFHLAPGGIYQRQAGAPENPYAYELLPSIVDHKHYMAAYCGICIYQGDMFPPEYQGHVFMGNIHQCAINHDRLIPNGSSFKAVAEKDFLTTTDGWFRPVSEQVGPDGALWIADWYDKYPCYQNAQADPEGVDRTYGRIWRVAYTNQVVNTAALKEGYKEWSWLHSRPSSKEPAFDLGKLKSEQLVALLEHPNIWQRRMAQKLLLERGRKIDLPDFVNPKNLSVLSVMLQTGWDVAEQTAAETRISAEQRVRALRFIGEQRVSSPTIFTTLEKCARDDDPHVRLAVATAIRQFVSSSLTIDTDISVANPVGKVLVALIESSSDAKDPLLPYMIWMASEPLIAKNPTGGLKWLAENGARTMPLSGILARKGLRRISDTGDTNKLDQAVEFLLKISDDRSGLASAALDGLIEGQKAKALTPSRDVKWVLATLRDNPDANVESRARDLGTIWNDPDSIASSIKLITDPSASLELRTNAIALTKSKKSVDVRDAILQVIESKNTEDIVVDALRALSSFEDSIVPTKIITSWNAFNSTERLTAIETLTSREPWVSMFLDLVEAKKVTPGEVSASTFRSIAHYKNAALDERTKQLLGRFRESSEDKQKIIREKHHMVLHEETDLNHGHEIAKKTCFVCHKLYGEGADVGPDLTGVGRSSLDGLLNNVIDPNQIVGKGYENVEVETKDGRNISGRMTENDANHVKLVSAGPKEEVIAKTDIESLRVSQLSVMPEGLEHMPDKDFSDLIWYILDPPGDKRPLTKELKKQLANQK